MEKLRCVDDAFRRQLESCQAAHQAELLRLANEKQKQIEQANQKVRLSNFYRYPWCHDKLEQVLCRNMFICEYCEKTSLMGIRSILFVEFLIFYLLYYTLNGYRPHLFTKLLHYNLTCIIRKTVSLKMLHL